MSSYKHLGLIIDSTLPWDAHIDRVVRKFSKKIGALKCGKCDDQRHKAEVPLSSGPIRRQIGSNAFWTTLSNARKNRHILASKRGLLSVVDEPTTTSLLNIVSLETLMQCNLLIDTFQCVATHAPSTPLLCNQYGLRTLKTAPNEPHSPSP